MNKDFNKFNSMHMDILKELGNIGAGNAITALSKMLNRKIDMKVPKAKIVEIKEVNEILGDPEKQVVGILLKMSGDINGDILFILEYKSAHLLINMLMGNSCELENEFTDIEMSALKEVGNILISSYLTALSKLTNLNILPSIPDIAIDMAGAVISYPAIQFGKMGDSVLYIETEFSEGAEKVIGDFLLIPDIKSFDLLLKTLGVQTYGENN